MICRILPHQVASGPANLAVDEALLELAAAETNTAWLRTYEWATPTLSLGYFQSLALARSEPRFQKVPLVRRLTGGGALWHHHEITYALVVPASHHLARPSSTLYRAVHAAIVATLTELGIPSARRRDTPRMGLVYEKRPLLCFTDQDPEDIVTKGVKIVGSAQRRRGGAVLQHGSLLLFRSRRTPELLGVCDVADEKADQHDWSGRLLRQIPDALGMRRLDAVLTDEAQARAVELERIRYRNCEWTGRR
jgi:lipoate-protein ligase A